MKPLFAAMTLILLGSAAALGFDAGTDTVLARYKAQKPVSGPDLAHLMGDSERWCYDEQAGACAWSDIYLEVSADAARFEIGNAFSDAANIAYIDNGVFTDRQICETGADWLPTVRASNRADGTAIGGRALETIKNELAANGSDGVIDCFDYLYLAADPATQTVTVLQRQYTDQVYRPEGDVTVTLHFDPDRASALTLRW